jgi:hypothetical protein
MHLHEHIDVYLYLLPSSIVNAATLIVVENKHTVCTAIVSDLVRLSIL